MYDFGAANTDRVEIAGPSSAGSRISLLTGWWRPTTLTAGRRLWSFGSITGAEVDSTTSELRLWADHATTDGQWTTTGANLALDNPAFLAFMMSRGTAATSWRVWVGGETASPAPVTVTQAVAVSGSATSATNLTIGNRSSGSVAWQGQIGELRLVGTTNLGNLPGLFGSAAPGAITQAAADFVEQSLVIPAWRAGAFRSGPELLSGDYHHWPAVNERVRRYNSLAAADHSLLATVTGASRSVLRAPIVGLASPFEPFRMSAR